MKDKKIAGYFIFGLTVLFITGYIMVSFHNRYQFDDLGLNALVRGNGVWKAFKYMYFSWETTYLSLIIFFLLQGVGIVVPSVFNISIFIVSILTFYLFLKSVIKRYFLEINGSKALLISGLVISILYFSCRAMGNVTYFVTGQIVYSLFLSFLFLGLYFWLNQNFILASVCMFLFGHTRINYDAIFIGLYFSYYGLLWIKNKKLASKWTQHIPFMFFILGMITYIIVPGNYKRAEYFEINNPNQHLNILLFIKGWSVAFLDLGYRIIHNWKQLIILPIGIILGVYLYENEALKRVISLRFLLYCSFAFSIAYLGQISILLIAIKTPIGYERIFFFLELLLFLLILLYGIYLGFWINSVTSTKFRIIILSSISITIFGAIGFSFQKNYRVTTVFAKAYDARIDYLIQQKQKGIRDDIYVPSLPASGMLMFEEMDVKSESSNLLPDNNAAYVNYYKLPFKIYVAK